MPGVIIKQLVGLPWWLRWWRIYLQCRRLCLIPGLGKIPWRTEWLPTPVFLPGESHGRRNLVGYRPWGRRVGLDWGTNTCNLHLGEWMNIRSRHDKVFNCLIGCKMKFCFYWDSKDFMWCRKILGQEVAGVGEIGSQEGDRQTAGLLKIRVRGSSPLMKPIKNPKRAPAHCHHRVKSAKYPSGNHMRGSNGTRVAGRWQEIQNSKERFGASQREPGMPLKWF